jgi:medium-chain acyl-[acyl-carrier-protein] hydrolase
MFSLQLPGRANRILETPQSHLPTLVQAIGEAILPLLDRPALFFGHSLGAILSFELARWLRRRYKLPARLVVSGRRAPHLPDDDAPIYRATDAEFIAKLRELNGTPVEILENAELLALLLPALRADFHLGETYVAGPEAPLHCSITVLGGSEDEESLDGRLDGWSRHTSKDFSLHIFPGDHFFLHAQRSQVLNVLTAELSRAARCSERPSTAHPTGAA